MFGNDSDQGQSDAGNPTGSTDMTHGSAVFPPVGTPTPAPQSEPSGPPVTLPAPTPPAADSANSMTLDDLAAAVHSDHPPELSAKPAASTPSDAAVTTPTTPDKDNLLDIKQQALQNLTPLVSKLDQSPLEKFKTTMMMIQASDDKSLIQTAYEAAEQITDEKEKAQALLDIVNEINYFTQQNEE